MADSEGEDAWEAKREMSDAAPGDSGDEGGDDGRLRRVRGANAERAAAGGGGGGKAKRHKAFGLALKPYGNAKKPEQAARRRAEKGRRIKEHITRPAREARGADGGGDEAAQVATVNRIILPLDPEERDALRKLGALNQEWYLATRETVVEFIEKIAPSLNSIVLRACEALSIRTINAIRERMACDAEGKRICTRKHVRKPTASAGDDKLVTVNKPNKEQGISGKGAVFVPYTETNRGPNDLVLVGRTLHLRSA